jgi:hypothetical protein
MGGHTYLIVGANKIIGNYYNNGKRDGRIEMLPDGGTISKILMSRCYNSVPNPDA